MELFASAVREGSFSAAGRRAGLSPAAVSRQVAALEASLNVQLLNRTSRTLNLTDAGRAYLARLEPILQDIADAEAAAAALQTTPRGTLRVHSRLMFGMRVVAPLIPDFQARYPDLRVELRLTEHAARLPEEEVDIDLRLSPSPDAALMQRRLLPGLQVTNTGFDLGIYAVFRQASLMPAKTRAFLDFLAEAVRAD